MPYHSLSVSLIGSPSQLAKNNKESFSSKKESFVSLVQIDYQNYKISFSFNQIANCFKESLPVTKTAREQPVSIITV